MVASNPVLTGFSITSVPSTLPAIPFGIELVRSRLFSGVVDCQDADPVLVGKLLEPADDLIVGGIAVSLTAHLPDFLKGIHDDELGSG